MAVPHDEQGLPAVDGHRWHSKALPESCQERNVLGSWESAGGLRASHWTRARDAGSDEFDAQPPPQT